MTVTAIIVAAGSGSRMGGTSQAFAPSPGSACWPMPSSIGVTSGLTRPGGKGKARMARSQALGDRDVGKLIVGGTERR